jgi:hemerythrin
LIPFARDHLPGLVRAVAMKKAEAGSGTDKLKALSGWMEEWEQRMRQHFLDEERLLPALLDPQEQDRLLGEHEVLRNDIEEARRQIERQLVDNGFCRVVGERLERHIRWEDRELFRAIEGRATGEQLAVLMAGTKHIQAPR